VTAQLLGGKELARKIKAQVTADIQSLDGGRPTLAVVVATEDDATHWYVRSIASAAGKAGVDCRVIDLGAGASQAKLEAEIVSLAEDPGVHGLILQTPLPPGVSPAQLVGLIPPEKDVDGSNPVSLGRLAVGECAFAPATARSVIELLDHHGIPVSGRHVAVVGRSTVVGKPLAHLLLQRDATVTVCHSRSVPLARFTQPADIVVVAAGKARLLSSEHISPGAVVVDVGTHVLPDGRLAGDADEASISEVASAFSPVPGGVGSVTTALLLLHTVEAWRGNRVERPRDAEGREAPEASPAARG
jgi:methylenetetrahydrofolate dehydrogenase (NADP+)/methenyltetrahydrofolate cyclohydrolase